MWINSYISLVFNKVILKHKAIYGDLIAKKLGIFPFSIYFPRFSIYFMNAYNGQAILGTGYGVVNETLTSA